MLLGASLGFVGAHDTGSGVWVGSSAESPQGWAGRS